MPKRLGDLKVARQGNEKLKLSIGSESGLKQGGSPSDLGYISVDRSIKKPPTHGPAK
jgi:hypothetical protein